MFKKLLLVLLLAGLGSAGYSQMQDLNVQIVDDRVQKSYQTKTGWTQGQGSKVLTTACLADTIEYGLAKATGLRAINMNNSGSALSIAQYYDAPQSLSISGMTFYAYKIDNVGGSTISVTAEIYNAGVDSMPAGNVVATATLQIDTTFGGGALTVLEKNVSFSSPVTMTQPYCVVISNNNAAGVGLVVNDYQATVADGLQEWLSSAFIGGNWLRGYQVSLGTNPSYAYDADAAIDPHVQIDLTSEFTFTPNCLLSAGTVTFTDQSSNILTNRMYNQAAYFGAADASYQYDFGDGTSNVYNDDTTHAYATGGPFTVTHIDTLYGWRVICADQTVHTISATAPSSSYTSNVNGLTVTFTDTSGGNPTSWAWDFGDGNTDTTQNPMHTFGNTGSYNVCLTITNSCGMDSSCSSVSVTCSSPTAGFTGANNGLSVAFTNTSVSGVTWAWDFGDGNTSTSEHPIHTYTAGGSYNVCLTTSNPCGSDSTCQAVGVTSVPPVAGFSYVTTGSIVNFSDTSTGGPTTWKWQFGDGDSSAVQDPTHNYATTGSYNVCLMVSNSNGADTTCENISVSVGIGESDFENAVRLFPNPSRGEVYLKFIFSEAKNIELQITDVLGRVVMQREFAQQLNSTQSLDFRNMNTGIYIVHITDGQSAIVRRLQITK